MVTHSNNVDIFTLPIGNYNLKENKFKYYSPEDIKDSKAPELTEYEVYIWSKPKSGCHHCFGRGHVGVDVKTSFKVPCRCIRAQYRKIGMRQTPKVEQQMKNPIYEA